MGYYAIGAVAVLVGALGGAYLLFDPFNPDQDQVEEAVVSEPREEPQASENRTTGSVVVGSAARRMDDFGTGPSGTTVTVPLRDRYKQAYSTGSAGGGAPGQLLNEAPIESAALPSESEGAETEEAEAAPAFRVIERKADETEAAAVSEAADDVETEISPTFDVVRVDPSGRTVMAGRAAPLTDVEIKVGDDVIDRVTTTATGEWVSTPTETLKSGDQELSLSSVKDGADPVLSRQIVVVSIPETTTEAEPDQPVAVILDKDEGGEGRILQAPDKLQSTGDDRLALKLVDYDDKGAVRLSGEAPPGVPVRIYVDNQPAALVIGDSKGYWITTLDQDLPGGDYTLRLDQLDLKGQTVARLETPFTRVTTPPVEGEAKVDYVVVQPGNSLWRIARRLSGNGFNYVYLFEANQAQIKDPDIIYPGQVFEVPSSVEIAG
ncbi:MAG: LysM peptidoglycan-binding domain-containing protein [Pseudomonadota bacterium]